MENRFRQDKLDPSGITGLVLCGMGGPDGPEAVEPFLRNLFSDPRILPAPAPVRFILGRLISFFRSAKIRARYAEIDAGGGSPQLSWTVKQSAYLAKTLNRSGRRCTSLVAMRYWHPFPESMLEKGVAAGVEQYLVVPAYPQFADVTSGNILKRIEDTITCGQPEAPIHIIPDWHLLPGYLEYLADKAAETIDMWRNTSQSPGTCALIFVAHSLPLREVRRGDPYRSQTTASLEGVYRLLEERFENDAWWREMPGGDQPLLAYQSRVGPVKWLGPNIIDEVRKLAASGCHNLLVVPLSFTCEHIETLHELDIDLRKLAESFGIRNYRRVSALNMNTHWLDSLADHLHTSAFAGNGPLQEYHDET